MAFILILKWTPSSGYYNNNFLTTGVMTEDIFLYQSFGCGRRKMCYNDKIQNQFFSTHCPPCGFTKLLKFDFCHMTSYQLFYISTLI